MPVIRAEAAMDRRKFLIAGGMGLAAAGLSLMGLSRLAWGAQEITLPPLPYPENALEPFISARTISFHYGKHHAGYVKKINRFIKGTPYEGKSLEEIVKGSFGKPKETAIFNNAAQVYNHNLYWLSMKPGGGGQPNGKLMDKIKADLGGYPALKEALAKAAGARFGSGWGWLALKDGKLTVLSTQNADTPLAHGMKPLLTIDVWEHAYYLDYQNRRGDYISAVLDNLVNWDFAASQLG